MSKLLADSALQNLILAASGQTLYMVGFSLGIAIAVGVPTGVLLVVSTPG
ncbi:MAG: metal ABC transporter permease, partial [Firmicutes bacterium]|nr:metal ABC transporter permease [Bacillota bacterium]